MMAFISTDRVAAIIKLQEEYADTCDGSEAMVAVCAIAEHLADVFASDSSRDFDRRDFLEKCGVK